ncbi:MAG: hypothetical protein AAGK97_06665 [Bacteroidota bacterium]
MKKLKPLILSITAVLLIGISFHSNCKNVVGQTEELGYSAKVSEFKNVDYQIGIVNDLRRAAGYVTKVVQGAFRNSRRNFRNLGSPTPLASSGTDEILRDAFLEGVIVDTDFDN